MYMGMNSDKSQQHLTVYLKVTKREDVKSSHHTHTHTHTLHTHKTVTMQGDGCVN